MANINEELKSGLTWRTFLALIVAILLFVPINLYSLLLLGVATSTFTIFFVTLLFFEVGRLFYTRFSSQETLILYYAAGWGGMVVSFPIYYNIIYRAYFIRSPFAWSYKINGVVLANLIPEWLVPSYGSEAVLMRTFFHPDFIPSVAVWTVYVILFLVAEVSIGTIVSRVYVKELDLPFPLATVDVSVVDFIARRPRPILKTIIMSLIVGLVWGVIAYVPGSFGGAFIPIPFFDLTSWIQDFLPGALFAVPTLLNQYFLGFVIPTDAATYMTISSLVMWIILNSLFVTTLTGIFPDWAREYSKGMGLIAIQNRSYIRVWWTPQLGFTLAVAIFLIIKVRKPIITILKQLFVASKEDILGFPSVKKMFAVFLLSTVGSVAFQHWLVPEIPIWVPLIASVGLSFFTAIVLPAMVGEVGVLPAGIPGWSWHILVYLTPYQGYSGFIFYPVITASGPANLSQQVKAALMTSTKPSDLIKIWIIGFLSSQILSLVILDIFWRMAPIPSLAYPASIYSNLQTAFIDSMMVTRQMGVTVERIFYPMLIMLAVLSIGEFLHAKTGFFFSSLGIIAGLFLLPHQAIAIFLGAMIGRFVMPRFLGNENWGQIKGYVVAGEWLGEGLVMMLALSFAMISKSSWIWPW